VGGTGDGLVAVATGDDFAVPVPVLEGESAIEIVGKERVLLVEAP
jgi:hypothetical protein